MVSRVVPVEMPHLNIHVLGLEIGMDPSTAARCCLEAFLRLRRTSHAAENNHSDAEQGLLRWAQEPEAEVVGGIMMSSRVGSGGSGNERGEVYVASKRTATNVVGATNQPVQAVNGRADENPSASCS